MRTKYVFFVLILLFSLSGFPQNNNKKTKPNEDIKVNKEFDKDGNLIRYDSTYVYTWSSDSCQQITPDSAFHNFSDIHEMRKKMQEQLEHFLNQDSSGNNQFHHPFFNEDFFNDDFFDPQSFNNDFFSRDSSHNDILQKMEKIMEEHMYFSKGHNEKMDRNLDSLHNDFMKKQKRYFQQRDSIYWKHRNDKSKSIDL
ncbi:hypothetical protein BZG01_12075 [Labilibaculum manganireducens]|uniref:Uncharacterized protein n=1 Tax=Labilibaculum manganireducens TaxID=1940525 RepID=A0A2N3I6Y9_9BACT|nr:hypothetical protein [Labilibaculum manganireducens]PKQ66092.1 hypothetical protein BZG01_12075 [Labilibaculum manganireducens]